MMQFMRRKAMLASLALLGILLPVASFAEGEGAESSIDISTAESLASDLGSTLSGFVTGNVIPAVLGIIGAVASLLLLFRVIRWLFRALGGR